jgi:integrase
VFSSLRRSFDRARQVSGIAENFTIHDLRRTVASKLGELGFDRSALIAKILNHSEGSGATKIYDRFKYDAEKRTALERWDRELARIVRGERAKVIEMADARERA